jgi:hypothetical protein
VIQGLGPGDVQIKISRVTKGGNEHVYTTDEINEDFIQQTYGGGRYICKIFVNGIFRQAVPLNIAEIRNAAQGPYNGIADLQMRMMQQQIDFMKDMMLRGSQREQTPVGELADAVLKVTQLQGGGGMGMDKVVDLLLKGVELGRANVSNGEGGDSWFTMIREALPLVGEMMKGRMVQQPETQQPISVVPDVAPMRPAVAAAAPEAAAGGVQSLISDSDRAMIRAGIQYLKRKALANADPGLYVDYIAGNVDEPQYEGILRFVLAQDFPAFASLDEDLAKPPYAQWFRDFYDGLRSVIAEQNPVETDSSGQGGDGRNGAGDGKARPARPAKSPS